MTDSWDNCYDESWKGLIVDEAFAHPAKISPALSRRIYEHAFERGWIAQGMTVVDPFGGICGTALHAATHGLSWVGVELESRFVALGQQNIELWRSRWGHTPDWVAPTLVQGDSRRLCELVSSAGVILSSPPFSIRQPPANARPGENVELSQMLPDTYGSSPGQLGAMPAGDIGAVISSPPYAESVHDGNGIDHSKLTGNVAGKNSQAKAEGYGTTSGQLGAMIVGSPPYEGIRQDGAGIAKEGASGFGAYTEEPADYWHTQRDQNNIGNLKTGDTFWEASRVIVAQCHRILRPGGHAIWVCKDFVRAKQRVPFSDQWLALCESLGFKLVCRHRAMLVKRGGKQMLLDGGVHETTRSRKSFFRRLAEKNGSPPIDFEDILCLART